MRLLTINWGLKSLRLIPIMSFKYMSEIQPYLEKITTLEANLLYA